MGKKNLKKFDKEIEKKVLKKVDDLDDDLNFDEVIDMTSDDLINFLNDSKKRINLKKENEKNLNLKGKVKKKKNFKILNYEERKNFNFELFNQLYKDDNLDLKKINNEKIFSKEDINLMIKKREKKLYLKKKRLIYSKDSFKKYLIDSKETIKKYIGFSSLNSFNLLDDDDDLDLGNLLLLKNKSFFKYDFVYIFFYRIRNKFIKQGKKGILVKIFNKLKRYLFKEGILKNNFYDKFYFLFFKLKPCKDVFIQKSFSYKKYYPKFLKLNESIIVFSKWVKNSLNLRRFCDSFLKEFNFLIKKNKLSKIMDNKSLNEKLFKKSLPYRKRKRFFKKRNVKDRIKAVKGL